MPMYEFKCKQCGNEFEELVRSSSEEFPPCPSCASQKVEKKVSLFGSSGGGGSCGTSGFS